MREYQYIMSLYEKQHNYGRHLFFFTLAMLVVPAIILALNFYHFDPFLLYLMAMVIVLIYRKRLQQKSKHYQALENFLQESFPEFMENKELVFFIDYQLNAYFAKESQTYFKRLKDGIKGNDAEAKENLTKMIIEVNNYYDYLAVDQDLTQDMEISLEWYQKNKEKRKHNLI